jgi:hypothetical protein
MLAFLQLLGMFVTDLFRPRRLTANSKRLTATANRPILAADERSLQLDLVRLDRDIPVPTANSKRLTVHTGASEPII